MNFPPTHRKAARAAFFALALAASTAVRSGTPTPGATAEAIPATSLGALLGMEESSLLQALPDLHKTARVVSGPRGTRGLWALPERVVAGIPLETVFFFKARKLERIEQRRLAPPAQCSQQFDQLTATLESRIGTAVRSTELVQNGNRSAAWSLEAYRLAAFQTTAAGSCTVMLVHEPLILKDAAEL